MNAKEYFQRMDELHSLLRIKLQKIAFLRDTLSLSGPAIDAEQVSHSRNMHVTADKIASIVDAEREADAITDELVDLRQMLAPIVKQLPDPKEILFVTERYFEGMDTDAIAEAHHYSRRRIQQMLKNAAEHVDALLAAE